MDRLDIPEHSTTPIVWSAKLVDWFFKNTQVVILLFLAVLIGGGFSLATLRSEGFPAPQLNIAVVTDLYRGASPTEVEDKIVKPIEVAVQGIKGVTNVQSTASNSFGSIQVSFDATSDFNTSLSEVRNKVQSVILPSDADRPDVIVPSFGGSISYYALTGATGSTPADLRAQGDYVKERLNTVVGVKQIELIQPVKDRVNINWNPAKLAQYKLTPLQLQQALQASNVTIPAGTITLDGRQTSVVTAAPFTSIDEINNLAIGADSSVTPPRAVTLGQVATATLVSDNQYALDTYSERTSKDSSIETAPALFYQLTYNDTADVVKSNKDVTSRIAEIQSAPEMKGATLKTVYNVADSISQQVSEIEKGAIGSPIGTSPFGKLGWALGAIWLIMLSMLLFVSWRAAIISVLAIPLSLLITFFALKVQGVTLNTLTLFSMVLVLALIVDPAIVLLEAVQHELDMGKRGRNAVIAAMNTIGIGAFIAVICNTLVFVPFGVVDGIFGQIIKFIPITVIPALIASYFVPLVFLTYLARIMLKPSRKHTNQEEIANLWKVSQWFVRTNTKILDRTWAQIVIIILAIIIPLGVSGALFASGKIVPVQFSSTDDNTIYGVNVEYPANLAKTQKQDIINQTEAILTARKDTKNFFVSLQSDNEVSFTVQLFDRADRDENSTQLVKDLNSGSLNALTKPSQRIFVTAIDQNITGPQSAPIAVNIYGDDLDALRKAAIATGDILRDSNKFPNITRVNDGFTNENNPQIAVSINRDKLASTGLPAIAVAQTLNAIVGENLTTKYEQTVAGSSRPVEIYMINAAQPTDVASINSTIVGATAQGQLIRVQDIATVSLTQGFTGINRLNGQRFVTITAEVKDALKDATAPQQAVKDFWTADKLKEYGLRSDALDDRGSGNEFLKSFQKLFIALGIACVMLYVVLALFFRSFAYPFIILFAIPLSFIGVFPALSLVGGQFGFLEILGIITLSGIAVNVGIFLIDLANQKRAHGMPFKQAIAEASGIRFRPIFLTKVTALGGLMPLIILSPFWRSLATVVLAGVLVSGILSLFTTPILYSWFTIASARIQRGYERRVHHKK